MSDSTAPLRRPAIFVTDEPVAEERALILAGLTEFNVQTIGMHDYRPLAVLVRDPETQQVVGGLAGRTSLGSLFVDLLYLPPALRGGGLGRELLQQAEDEARRRGCRSGVLYTLSFQAPDFYQRNGWEIFGEVPCDPPGTRRMFLTKDLLRAEGDSRHAGDPSGVPVEGPASVQDE
jgi:GNAT superfamily N-acetyltransferase